MCLISESIAIVIGNMFVNHGTWCFPQFSVNPSYHIVGDISHEISPLNTHFLTMTLCIGNWVKVPTYQIRFRFTDRGEQFAAKSAPIEGACQRKEWQDQWMMVPNDAGIQKMRMMMLGVLKTSQMYRHHGFPRICGENSCSVASPQTGTTVHGMPPSCSAGACVQGVRAWATTKLKLKKYKEKNWSYHGLLTKIFNHHEQSLYETYG